MSAKKRTYTEELTDWVLQFGDDGLSPTDAQFSAVEVANLIIKFNRDQKSIVSKKK